MLYWVIFFIIAGMFTIIALLKINIVIELVKNGKDDHFVVSMFTLGKIVKLKYEIPFLDVTEEGIRMRAQKKRGRKEKNLDERKKVFTFSSLIDQYKALRGNYKKNYGLICSLREYAKRKFVLKEIKLDAVVGTGEAHYTAILSGVLWALSGSFMSIISNFMRIEDNKTSIRSDFNERKFLIDLYCIIQFKIVHIIVIGLKLLLFYLKEKLTFKNNTVGGGLSG